MPKRSHQSKAPALTFAPTTSNDRSYIAIMFITSLLATALAVFSLTSAAPVDTNLDLETRQSTYTWHISKFEAECHSGICSYQMQIDAPRYNGIPSFTATCSGENVPRGSTQLRNCSVNKGNLEGVQGVQAFIELRPVRPNIETRLVIQMGWSRGDGTVNYWRGRQTGNYKTFTQDLTQAGSFDIVPFKYAAVA